MLEVLQTIVETAANAATADAALKVIVARVRAALHVDQCSIYVVDPTDGSLVLAASDGLDPKSIGEVRLAVGQGLVGTIGAQRRPLHVEDALGDPRNVYFPITGEERYRAFLGAPLIHLSELVGVITLQTVGSRQFSNQEEAFAVTVAAHLAGIANAAARQLTLARTSNGVEPAWMSVRWTALPSRRMGRRPSCAPGSPRRPRTWPEPSTASPRPPG